MTARFAVYTPDDWRDLLGMYTAFEPKAVYQGLPPYREAVTDEWLGSLVNNPTNTHLVLRIDGRVAGHAALIHYPTEPGSEEILIFVHQSYQRQGWGRRLFLTTMHWACRHKGLDRVWLTVDLYNSRARRLYHDIGFAIVPAEDIEPDEVEMERPLQCRECLMQGCPIFTSGRVGMGLEFRAASPCTCYDGTTREVWTQ